MTKRHHRSGLRLAVGITALILSACGSRSTSNATAVPPSVGSTSTNSRATYPDACKLLVPSEVQAWTHGLVGSGRGTASVCTFANKNGRAITVQVEGPVVGFAAEMHAYHGVAFAGAGDAAFESRGRALVAFVKGSTQVVVASNTPIRTAVDVNALETLARDAAHRW
jgi:hypothetical protein